MRGYWLNSQGLWKFNKHYQQSKISGTKLPDDLVYADDYYIDGEWNNLVYAEYYYITGNWIIPVYSNNYTMFYEVF